MWKYFNLAISAPLDKINKLGNDFLKIGQTIGYWIILVAGISKIIEKVVKGDNTGAIKTAITYALIFAVLYLLPFFMDSVKAIFGG